MASIPGQLLRSRYAEAAPVPLPTVRGTGEITGKQGR